MFLSGMFDRGVHMHALGTHTHKHMHITLFKLGKIFSILKSDNYVIKKNIYIHFIYCFTKLPSGKPMIEIVGLFSF